MEDKEILEKIKEIVYSVPDELYKYSKPDQYWDDNDWANIIPNEKGFILIKELIENEDIQSNKEKDEHIQLSDAKKIILGECPAFLNNLDEKLFFNIIYSMPSFLKIEGCGRNLFFYYKEPITLEEKNTLRGLLKRYQMRLPKELE